MHQLDSITNLSVAHTIQSKIHTSFLAYSDRVAIIDGSNCYTYYNLDKASNRVSQWLLTNKLSGGKHIALCLQDRTELIIWILGILKSRSVFIPLDYHHPEGRIQQLLEISDTDVLITDRTGQQRLSSINSSVAVFAHEDIDVPEEDLSVSDIVSKHTEPSGEDKIYIYFTSGSTGVPKAIVGKNSSLHHFVTWEVETFRLNENSRVSQFISPGFDAFLRDIFPVLSVGGTICIPDTQVSNSAQILNWIADTKISLIHCVPSFFKLLLTQELEEVSLSALRYILLSGEKINAADLQVWYDKVGDRVQLVNLYGATETTMIKTYYLIQPEDATKKSIPIGKPIPGTQVFLLDDHLRPVGKKSVGEIYIRTKYGTYGYYNNEELTSERFIKNPYSTEATDVLYKTGDLGRFNLLDDLEFLGRVDRQVKVRGVRIEPDEIEQLLIQHQSIKDAIVKANLTSEGDAFLCAYIIIEKEIKDIDIKVYLTQHLPTYLIPTHFIFLTSYPLLSNGKVDFNSLPNPEQTDHRENVEYIAPRSEVEAELVKIVAQALGKEEKEVGINDNFFDLGANSISLVAILSKINSKFNINLSLVSLHQWPNIGEYVKYMTNQDALEHTEKEYDSSTDLSEALEDMIDIMNA